MQRRLVFSSLLTAVLVGTVVPAVASSDLATLHGRVSAVHHSAQVGRVPGGGASVGGDPSPAQICYSQPPDGTGNGVVSEDFGSGPFASYTSLGADDFRLLTSCTITQLVIPGQVSGSGTAVGSFTVTFYNDSGGSPAQPGTVAYPATSVVPVIGPAGIYTLTLPGAGFAASANTIYWVSVQAANVTPAGDLWFWDTAVIQGYPAVFENPLGGFGTCTTWDTLQTCVGLNSDFAFELDGTTAPPPCYSQFGALAKPVNSQGGPGIPNPRRTEAADDFTLAQPCSATSVDVLGTYVGSGSPPASGSASISTVEGCRSQHHGGRGLSARSRSAARLSICRGLVPVTARSPWPRGRCIGFP